MALFASSDPFVLVAWGTGLTTLALAAALTLQLLRMRWIAAQRARRELEFVAAWRPVLFDAALGGSPAIPRVAPGDEGSFLLLWNHVQDTLAGDSRAALNHVAEIAGADAAARRLLRGNDPVACVQALRMLGHLGRPDDYEAVREFLDDSRAYLSLAAARALVSIDAMRAPADVVPRIASRLDWPASLLVTALADASAGSLASQLRAACVEGSSVTLLRVLPLVALVDDCSGEEILRHAFRTTADPEVVAAVLKCVRTPALAELARASHQHAEWTVRTQAAAALGRIGAAGDRALLLRLLTDSQWWVRYRAAQALVSGRFGSRADLTARVENLQDLYARDILAHAAAEGRA